MHLSFLNCHELHAALADPLSLQDTEHACARSVIGYGALPLHENLIPQSFLVQLQEDLALTTFLRDVSHRPVSNKIQKPLNQRIARSGEPPFKEHRCATSHTSTSTFVTQFQVSSTEAGLDDAIRDSNLSLIHLGDMRSIAHPVQENGVAFGEMKFAGQYAKYGNDNLQPVLNRSPLTWLLAVIQDKASLSASHEHHAQRQSQLPTSEGPVHPY